MYIMMQVIFKKGDKNILKNTHVLYGLINNGGLS